MKAEDLQTWMIAGAASVGVFLAWRAYQTGTTIADQAAEGASIVGQWLNQDLASVWRDLTRGGVEPTDHGSQVEQALAQRYGEDWQELLEPWDEDLADEMRAYLASRGLRESAGENGVFSGG